MSIEFKEVTEVNGLFECLEVQQKIFGLNEIQTIPMLILNSLGNNPSRSGLIVGAYDTSNNKLVGFGLNICTMRPDTMYNVASGMLPEYQKSQACIYFFTKIFELIHNIGVKYVEFFFNPLKPNLGKLYIHYYQAKGIKFVYNAFPEFENSHRIFAKGHTAPLSLQKPHDKFKPDTIPILREGQEPDGSDRFQLQIPEETEDPTFFFRALDRLINHEGYIVENCISHKKNGSRQYFYLLKKENANHLFN